jgi:DNA mismatch endonuclease, patch repair protein
VPSRTPTPQCRRASADLAHIVGAREMPERTKQHGLPSTMLDEPARMSWASTPAARRVMQGNKKRDTRPELAVRKAAHALGLRYKVACRPSTARRWTADLVFPTARVAVFIDGCFWHHCPEHFKQPRTNSVYWREKIARNRARDARVNDELASDGWGVLRFWEHEPPQVVAAAIAAAVTVSSEAP